MRRLHPPRLVPLTLGLIASVIGCGAPQPEGNGEENGSSQRAGGPELTTPRATLEAAKTASAQHDARKLCRYFTPQAQATLAAGSVALARFLAASSRKPDRAAERDGGEQNELSQHLRRLLEEYGLTDETLPKIRIDGDASEEDQLREVRKLAGPIEDHCAFFADFMRVLRKHGDKPDARLIEENAHLEGLKIEGDTAEATFVQSREGRETSDRIEFRRLEGQWKISRVPTLFN